MLICKTYFSKLQSDPNSDHTITVYAIKKRTFRDSNSRPGETDPYGQSAPGPFRVKSVQAVYLAIVNTDFRFFFLLISFSLCSLLFTPYRMAEVES